jgi:hypothetical protein
LLPFGLKSIAVGAASFQLHGQAPEPCGLGRLALKFGANRLKFSLKPITIGLELYGLIRAPLLLGASRVAFRFQLCEPRGNIRDVGFVLGSYRRNLIPQPVALGGEPIALALQFLVGLPGFRVRRLALAMTLQLGPKRLDFRLGDPGRFFQAPDLLGQGILNLATECFLIPRFAHGLVDSFLKRVSLIGKSAMSCLGFFEPQDGRGMLGGPGGELAAERLQFCLHSHR